MNWFSNINIVDIAGVMGLLFAAVGAFVAAK